MSDNLRMPPHSDEAETSVLGSILIDNDAILAVSEFLRPEHFYDPNKSSVYEAMLGLYESRSPIDMVTVAVAQATGIPLSQT